MAPLPPPPLPGSDGPAPIDPERAARLERLAQRSSSSARTAAATTTSTAGDGGDRAARLERLAQRSAPQADGASFATRARRNHPAKGARAAAFGLSVAATAGLAAVFATLAQTPTVESAAVIVSTGANGASALTPATSTTSTAPTTSAAPTTVPAPNGSVTLVVPDPTTSTTSATDAPGQVTVVDGAVDRNKWGPVQVEATFAPDGSLIDVVALQYPNDRGTSIRINDYALPRLNGSALTSQTADVHTVSGATYTSNSYRKSLQSAIDAARSAGVTTIA